MNFDDYKNTKNYPSKIAYTTYKVITVNKTYEDLNYEEFVKCKKSLTESKIQFLVDKSVSDEYEQKIKEYNDENYQLEQLFQQDLKEYYGDFSDYPNGEEIFSAVNYRAYEKGHSSGYWCIAEAYGDLYDFVRQILKLAEKQA